MARQESNYEERIKGRQETPFDPPSESVSAPPREETPNKVGSVTISKPGGSVTSKGGSNFTSKYPALVKSVGAVVSGFHKTFTEKEEYSAVDVSHNITNNSSVATFCSYLIDGSSDRVSDETQWRSFTIKQEMIEALKVGDPPGDTPEEPSKETAPPQEVKAEPAPNPSNTTPSPNTTPSSNDTSSSGGRGGRGGRGPFGGRGRGRGRTSIPNPPASGPPSGGGRYPFETRSSGGSMYSWRPNRGGMGGNALTRDGDRFSSNSGEWRLL